VKRIVRFTALAIVVTALAGCAYKPLKAPCSPDEGGVPLAYSGMQLAPAQPEAFKVIDHCGPMRPI
jgi:hypothetical protein